MSPRRDGPRVVALGGGTGLPAVLRGLLYAYGGAPALPSPDVTGIVTVMDDGGSSGRLRQALGVLPMGDVRNCLSALSPNASAIGDILHHRISCDGIEGHHPVGNLLLAALSGVHGNMMDAIRSLSAMLGTSGRVLPATLADVHLCGEFNDGTEVRGETAITARRGRLDRVRLSASARPLPEAIDAILNADLVVVGPGSLYTSLIPTLLIDGMASALSAITAPRVYVANLMTQPGETDEFTLADHLAALRYHTKCDLFDYVLVNRRPFAASALAAYARDGAHPVTHDGRRPWNFRTRIVTASIGVTTPSGVIRHDPVALGYALTALARRAHPQPPAAVHTHHVPHTSHAA
ncbi:MAG TPA: gluconeogenesis factor YvcK family protein [Vicinamibacterales bacterium]|nr:gluconeogenesis factor YvcK family protein [Vicinamibacterales bacterium]